jgi:hypothetical protein
MAEIEQSSGDEQELSALARECAAIARWMLADASVDDRLAGSVPFQTMCAVVVAAWQLQRQAALAAANGGALARTKPAVARFFLDVLVPEALGLRAAATAGASVLYRLAADELIAE